VPDIGDVNTMLASIPTHFMAFPGGVIVASVRPSIVHAGLMAVGAQPGSPVRFIPKFEPASGAQIEIGYVLARGQAGTTFEVFEPLDQVYLKFRADF